MSAPEVMVIGAGPAGLAAAAELGRLRVPCTVLEQADSVAAAWRGRYDRLRLNTCRWTSRLPNSSYPAHAGLFPSRDQIVSYLEDYAQRHALDVRVRTRVERIDRHNEGWQLQTSAGPYSSRQVIVATGHDHTPYLPSWPGRDRYTGRLLHAAGYRNAQAFLGARVAVAGAGSSGLEIAYDLAEGGAERVWVCARTRPNIMLRQSGGLPGDLPAIALLRLPPRTADAQARLVRRLTIGDLTPYGLAPPAEGIFTRLRREGKAPAIVTRRSSRRSETAESRSPPASNRSTTQAWSSPAEHGSRQTSSSQPPATRPGWNHSPDTSAYSTSAASPACTAGKPQHPACASSATSPGPGRSAT